MPKSRGGSTAIGERSTGRSKPRDGAITIIGRSTGRSTKPRGGAIATVGRSTTGKSTSHVRVDEEDKEVEEVRSHGRVDEQYREVEEVQSHGEEKHQESDCNNGYAIKKRRTRGPTHMAKTYGRPSICGHIKVRFNRKTNKPVGKNKAEFAEFLGTISRNGIYCPLDVKDWKEMGDDRKITMLTVVKEKFVVPPVANLWILQTLSKYFRNWKAHVKAKYYDPDESVEEQLCKIDDARVCKEQYKGLLPYWQTEKAKVVSEKNKRAKAMKTMNHNMGKRSFVQVERHLAILLLGLICSRLAIQRKLVSYLTAKLQPKCVKWMNWLLDFPLDLMIPLPEMTYFPK